MKGLMKVLYGMSFSLAVIAVSCTKNQVGQDLPAKATSSRMNIELIEEVEELPTSVVPLGYAKFSSAEKVEFWLRHVDRYLNNHPEFPDALVAHIEKLKGFAHVDLYDKGDIPEMREYIENFEKTWYREPIEKGIFPAKALTEASTFWGTGKSEQTLTALQKTAVTSDSESSSCNCIYDLGCPTNKYCYDKPECEPGKGAPANCGVFGTSRCSGKCE